MLKQCTQEEYRKYADFAYQLAADPSRSGYPSYSDGIKTKAMFLERAEKAFSRETEDILLFEYEGVTEGWIHYYTIPADLYISTVSLNIAVHTDQALEEFLAFLQARFPGYMLYLGFSKKNTQAIGFLQAQGFSCIEEDYNNTALVHQYVPVETSEQIVRISQDNYALFCALHRIAEKEMYWNCERIRAELDNWVIFARLQDGETVGCVYYMIDDDGWFEIFGIDLKDDVFDAALFRELLCAALNAAKALGGTYMTYFCSEAERAAVQAVGFTCVDAYVCYKKTLAPPASALPKSPGSPL